MVSVMHGQQKGASSLVLESSFSFFCGLSEEEAVLQLQAPSLLLHDPAGDDIAQLARLFQ